MFRNLEAEMCRRGITIADLALTLEICQSSARNKLTGRSEFKHKEIVKIMGLFSELTWSYLFAQEQEPPERRVS